MTHVIASVLQNFFSHHSIQNIVIGVLYNMSDLILATTDNAA